MLFKDKINWCLVDRTIVNKDFIIARGSTYNLYSDKIMINGKNFYKPSLGVWKVHKHHPMIIQHPINTTHFINVWPYMSSFGYEGGRGEHNKKMPADIFDDRKDYDLAFFVFMPESDADESSKWKKVKVLEDALVQADGKKSAAALWYAEHGWDFRADDVAVATPIMPSQVPLYAFHNFLTRKHDLYTGGRDEPEKIAHIELTLGQARETFEALVPLLEKRFETQMYEKR
ncbi:MAG: SLAP domain-containing protein [archaeon]